MFVESGVKRFTLFKGCDFIIVKVIWFQVEENFIKIQEAYELLSDPVKRQQYDSSLDFDEMLASTRQTRTDTYPLWTLACSGVS